MKNLFFFVFFLSFSSYSVSAQKKALPLLSAEEKEFEILEDFLKL
jgi:hypothetical protein